jgi:hypothetical protein
MREIGDFGRERMVRGKAEESSDLIVALESTEQPMPQLSYLFGCGPAGADDSPSCSLGSHTSSSIVLGERRAQRLIRMLPEMPLNLTSELIELLTLGMFKQKDRARRVPSLRSHPKSMPCVARPRRCGTVQGLRHVVPSCPAGPMGGAAAGRGCHARMATGLISTMGMR